jgi:hypothetical protein
MEELQDKAIAWIRIIYSDPAKLKAFTDCAENFLFFSNEDSNTVELKVLLQYIKAHPHDLTVSRIMYNWDRNIRKGRLNYDTLPQTREIIRWNTKRSFADSQDIWQTKFNGGSSILKEIERRKIRWEAEINDDSIVNNNNI